MESGAGGGLCLGSESTNVSRSRRWPSLFSVEGGTRGGHGGGEILVPQERMQHRTVNHAPVPQFLDETVEVKLVSQGRVQQQTAEQFVDVPQILEEHVDVVRLVPQERMQRVGEQSVEVSIPQISEHNEQIVDVPVPQEEIAEVIPLTPHEVQHKNKSRS